MQFWWRREITGRDQKLNSPGLHILDRKLELCKTIIRGSLSSKCPCALHAEVISCLICAFVMVVPKDPWLIVSTSLAPLHMEYTDMDFMGCVKGIKFKRQRKNWSEMFINDKSIFSLVGGINIVLQCSWIHRIPQVDNAPQHHLGIPTSHSPHVATWNRTNRANCRCNDEPHHFVYVCQIAAEIWNKMWYGGCRLAIDLFAAWNSFIAW